MTPPGAPSSVPPSPRPRRRAVAQMLRASRREAGSRLIRLTREPHPGGQAPRGEADPCPTAKTPFRPPSCCTRSSPLRRARRRARLALLRRRAGRGCAAARRDGRGPRLWPRRRRAPRSGARRCGRPRDGSRRQRGHAREGRARAAGLAPGGVRAAATSRRCRSRTPPRTWSSRTAPSTTRRTRRRCTAEVHRLLRPGGRFVVSDIVAERELPEAVRRTRRHGRPARRRDPGGRLARRHARRRASRAVRVVRRTAPYERGGVALRSITVAGTR